MKTILASVAALTALVAVSSTASAGYGHHSHHSYVRSYSTYWVRPVYRPVYFVHRYHGHH